ncbi:hypothetical protein CEXT_573021 [Caerostris extrusa]|uniref:Uncharacterized protein n=1 Tax=Caerostris extrusa TaxID=172846 RepID=A0AAV4XTW2_CAEEX|nr:hypothetical protein CEXT_573021 [Caerostris extrusa]
MSALGAVMAVCANSHERIEWNFTVKMVGTTHMLRVNRVGGDARRCRYLLSRLAGTINAKFIVTVAGSDFGDL